MIINNLTDWLTVLSYLQIISNNMYQSSTYQTLNKVLYSFCLSEALDLLQLDSIMTVEAHLTDKEYITEWLRLWEAQKKDLLITMFTYQSSYIDVKDVIAWAVMQVKHYYNINWQPQFFAVKDKVLLRLHCEYKLSEITNWKLEQQFIQSFRVTE